MKNCHVFIRFPRAASLAAVAAAVALSAFPVAARPSFMEPRLSVGGDTQLGLRYGYGKPWTFRGRDAAAGVLLDFEGRILPKRVEHRVSPTLAYQFDETRFALGPGVYALVPTSDEFSWTAALGASWSDGFYWGSNRPPKDGWYGWAEAGFRLAMGQTGHVGMALQYRALPDHFPARVLLQFGWSFGGVE